MSPGSGPPVVPRPLPDPPGRRPGDHRALDPGRGPQRPGRQHRRPDRTRCGVAL